MEDPLITYTRNKFAKRPTLHEARVPLDFEQRREAVDLAAVVMDEPDDAAHAIIALRAALQALYDAIPTGFGEDRALNEATKQAEKVLGISR